MNRHERRRTAAQARHDKFVDEYVHHLPEISLETLQASLGKPGVFHLCFYHDEWCRIYDGDACNCKPDARVFAEPERS